MAKRVNTYIELDGPLFNPNMVALLHGAVNEGMKEIAEGPGAELVASAIAQGGFRKTGAFIAGIEGLLFDEGGGLGYATVKAKDAWPMPGRPTRTWMERGTRKGVKLRKGVYGFRKAATAMRAIDFNPFIADKIEKALN